MTAKNIPTEIVRQFIESTNIAGEALNSRAIDKIPAKTIAEEIKEKWLRAYIPIKASKDDIYYRLLGWAISQADYIGLVEEFLALDEDIAR